MSYKIITINGQLGSGKSSVAKRLASIRGAEYWSTGNAQREIAERLRISTLELNKLAETDPSIDRQIDSVFREIAKKETPSVVESRMAWYFLPTSLKVNLLVSLSEAAQRVHNDTTRKTEKSETIEETAERLIKRRESELKRYSQTYGVNIEDESNYQYIIDTTSIDLDSVVKLIDTLANSETGKDVLNNKFWVSSANLFPTTTIERQATLADFDYSKPVTAIRAKDVYFIDSSDHERVSSALATGKRLLPVRFIKKDVTVDIPTIREWEKVNNFHFDRIP